MDSDSDPQKWLGFSLSNHYHSHLSLFEAFNTAATTTNSVSVVNSRQQQRQGGKEPNGAVRGATDLSIFATTGPKLEDFLGGSTAAPPPPSTLLPSQSLVSDPVTENSSGLMYDSELKTIAASFLGGFSSATGTGTVHKYQQLSESTPRKSVDTFGQRTSIYRGVTRHRWTGRYEAHLWDNSCRREGQSRKGRQVYLGGYDKEEKAARAYDLAALKYWGPTTTTNFSISNYEKELEEMKHMTRQEFVASLRRKSSGFSRGASIYRGVTRHHQHGRWQARIGRVAGNKDLYLGTFTTQEEAAEAYDIAAIKFRGLNAVTNFDMSRYDVKSIANSNLPIGGNIPCNHKPKNSSDSASDNKSIGCSRSDDRDISSASSVTFGQQQQQPPTPTLTFTMPIKQDLPDYWSNIFGCQNSSATNSKNSMLFQSSIAGNSAAVFPGFDMGFKGGNGTSFDNGVMLSNSGYMEQQTTSSLPIATPISNYGNWISQSMHTFQSAKPNVSVFQTPIFGME